MTNETDRLTFWDHVEEFRKTLLVVLAVIFTGCILCFWCYPTLVNCLTGTIPSPEVANEKQLFRHELKRERLSNEGIEDKTISLKEMKAEAVRLSHGVREVGPEIYLIPVGAYLDIEFPQTSAALVLFSPFDGFIVAMKTSLWLSLLLTSPLWLIILMRFIYPALRSNERRIALPFLVCSSLFLWLGFVVAFKITIPLMNAYFLSFNEQIGRNFWSLREYFDYTLWMGLASGFAFEIGFILLFLVYCGLITASGLASWRKTMIVAAFVAGAFLTPPDVLSQVMLAVPLIVLYEAAYVYAVVREYYFFSRKGKATQEKIHA